MKKTLLTFLLLTTLASILLAPRSIATSSTVLPQYEKNQPEAGQKGLRPEFVAGEALVRFKPGRAFEGSVRLPVPNDDASIQAAGKAAALAQSQEQVLVTLDRSEASDIVDGLRLARMAPADTLKAIAALQARDDVLYAEPNYLRRATVTPNDPCFPPGNINLCSSSLGLYGLNKIGAPQAWDLTTGNRNVVVAVVDTGIDVNHPDLQANIWTNPAPGSISGISGDVHGYDFISNSGAIPVEPHATHVAGTIGAVGNNGIGVVGVNWVSSLMSLRFIDYLTGSGSAANAIRAYSYAKQMRDLWVSTNGAKGANIRVVNASFGGSGYSQAEEDALNALGQSGILFVAAAGNSGRNTDVQPNYPSGYELSNVISVAATDSNDALASFSNFGTRTVMLGAPGVNILSTVAESYENIDSAHILIIDEYYASLSGTSMAAPHVTGAAALLCAANPNLTVNQLRALLSFNGDSILAPPPSPSPTPRPLQGSTLSGRRLNVFKSLQAMNEGDTIPPGVAGGFQVTSQNSRTVNLAWIASGDDGAAGQASIYDLSFIDQATGATIPITSLAPPISGTAQSISANIPYRHTSGTLRLRAFDNAGNEGRPPTVSVNIPPNVGDPYITTLNPPAQLSTGGTPLGLTYDDRYLFYQLPFAFSFFGQVFNTVTISTNGALYFSPPLISSNGDAADVPSSALGLPQFKMIAGLWDDLYLGKNQRADADVYVVTPNSSSIMFRWQGVPCNPAPTGGCQFGGDPINFEIELRADGTIVTRYGAGNTNLSPVVGISGGERDPYVINSLTSELTPKSLTNAPSVVFAPRAAVQLSAANYNVNEAAGSVNITLSRSGDTTSDATVSLTTSDAAAAQNCNVNNGKASARCDYIATTSTVRFAPGETSKSVSIPIIDDSYAEGDETFTVSLSNGLGASPGAQSIATVTIIDNDSSTASNLLDVSDMFVREQYFDFLNRNPDPAGLAFWTAQISNCNPQPSCVEAQRINVSAAFFLSIEFQQTGYLVERLYKAAYGDAAGTSTNNGTHQLSAPIIRFSEFLPDAQQIGRGVIVLQPGWEQVLENNKQDFITQFVQRTRFATALPTSMSPADFVDRLNQNAGKVLSESERAALIGLFGGAPGTSDVAARTQALRQVAENQNLYHAEFNRAFVLMQYFGYLRRNPDDSPDGDHTGYDFWLSKLNQFNGDYQQAEMVKAFVTSSEYRQRLGPAVATALIEVGSITKTDSGGNGNGVIEPGESGNLNIPLTNTGLSAATGITATLRTWTPGVSTINGSSSYPDLTAFGARASNKTAFTITLAKGMADATYIYFWLDVFYNNGRENTAQSWSVIVPVGMNGSFETGDFTAWNVSTASTGGLGTPYKNWMVSHAGDSYDTWFSDRISPPDGVFDAWNGFDGAGPMEYRMYQDITVPNGTSYITWKDRIQWVFCCPTCSCGNGTSGPTQAKTFSVQLRDPNTNSVLTTLYTFSTGTTVDRHDTGWRVRGSDLSAYAGQTVRLYFVEVIPEFHTGPGQFQIDAITLGSGPLPPLPTPTPSPTPTPTPATCPTAFTVNDNSDASDAKPADGVCASAGGACTLRAAIQEANALGHCPAININLGNVASPIILAGALPDINHRVNLNGPGANQLTVQRSTASGTSNFRIFTIQSGVTANISGITISNGNLPVGTSGAALVNSGQLTFANSTVSANTTVNGFAVFNASSGTLTLSNDSVIGNSGGGILNSGVLAFTNSTVSDNSNTIGGGGIFNNGTLRVTNSTVSGNAVNSADGRGGGILNNDGATVTITNSTMTGNRAGNGGGIYDGVALVNLSNTIVAGNTGNVSGPDLFGIFNSRDYNLIGNTSGATFTGAIAHNLTNVGAGLAALANNGGSTQTHALLPGSPAIDAGSNTLAVDQNGNPLSTDQRGPGFSRVFNGTVDIGAFEAQTPGPSPTPTVSPTPTPTATPTPAASPTATPTPPAPKCLDDSWTATSTLNAPSPREGHSAVWTGTEMIIWGGYQTFLDGMNTGARYNPTTDTWTPISTVNAPAPRANHSAVWTGTEMIIWGGWSNSTIFSDGAKYNPSTDTWTPISTVNSRARTYHQGFWTGSEMIVWGGWNHNGGLWSVGDRYNPSTDSWTATSMADALSGCAGGSAVWTGSEVIVKCGGGSAGARYNPSTDTWTAISPMNGITAFASGVWSGSEMIGWGATASGVVSAGGRYFPSTDSWTAIGTTNAPAPRGSDSAVWTGSEMIVWGGGSTNPLISGGRYNPATDSWTATCESNAPVGRSGHTAIWTGREMIVWGGGWNSTTLNTGGRYFVPVVQFPIQQAPDYLSSRHNFWLNKLNQFNGDFIKAEMVKAFIASAEYRKSFGQP